jgi:amidohydrolase
LSEAIAYGDLGESTVDQGAERALVEGELIAIRRHLHSHPELSGKEIDTTSYLSRRLTEYGIKYRFGPEGLGLISDLSCSGQSEGPIVALRADLDALPIQEENEVPYCSEHAGVMHACGHDAHTAMLLGSITALNAAGPVSTPVPCRAIFQSSEETGQGALDMVRAGAMEGVGAIIALHVDPNLPSGSVGISSGPQTACCQDFTITVKGRGGHAARPHLTIDPIAIGAQLLTQIYQTIPRNSDVRTPVVVTVGEFRGGYCTNVIPDTATLRGTIRTLDFQVAGETRGRLQRICDGVSLSSGGGVEIRFDRLLRGVVNDPVITAICLEAAREVVGDAGLITEARPSMGAEDFADYLTEAPGCMMRLGVGRPGGEIRPLHTPTFDIEEDSLLIGARILLRSATLLGRHLS